MVTKMGRTVTQYDQVIDKLVHTIFRGSIELPAQPNFKQFLNWLLPMKGY